MRLSYHDMEMDISLEGLIEIEYFTWKEAVNIHGKVQIQFLADEDVILEILLQSAQKTEIIIMEKNEEGISQKTFCGKASRIWSKKDKGLFYLWAEFVSYTKEWDLTPKSQSFCRLSQSYTEVLYEVLYEYPQKDIRDEITQGQAIKDMLLQYEETDWAFLKRLASHFSTFLVADSSADCGRAYFGIPNINYGTELLLEEYQISRSQNKYDKIIHSSNDYPVSELLPQELTQWEICSRKRLHLAETVWLNGIEVVVAEFTFHTVKGELIRNYKLCRKKGMLYHRAENPKIYGMSIPATVKERSGNRVRVHMDIDQIYIPGEDLKYFTYAIESSSIYCMPEENSRVHIYFPSHNEADAIAVHAISMGGAGKNPRNKSFSTPANMAMEMKEDHYSFDAGGSSLYIGIDGAFKLTGKSIQLITQAEFSVGNEIQPESIEVDAKNELNFHVEGTSIALTEDACIVAAFIAHSAVKKSVPSPSAETLEAEVRANDAAIMTQINENAEAYLMSLADQRASARQQVRKGILGLVGAALMVGVVIATGGLAVGPVFAVAASVIATNQVMSSASNICQGRENYRKANQGDMDLAKNNFQSMLGMSDKQYAAFQFWNNMLFDAVTMTATTVNLSTKAFSGISNCTTRQLARGSTMMAVQGGKSVLDQFGANKNVEGKTLIKTFLLNSAIGGVAGITGGLAGNYAVSGLGAMGIKLPEMVQYSGRVMVSGVTAGTVDFALHLPVAEEKMTFDDYIQTVAVYSAGLLASDVVLASMNINYVHDPIDAATGAYLAREIDLALAGIRDALLWERKYNSLRKRTGILGTGWYSPLEGRLCREEDGRLHVEIPSGATLLFAWIEDAYQEVGEIKGRYQLKTNRIEQVWELLDLHTHETLQYDAEGKLAAIIDQNGQETRLFYENDYLFRLVTPLGHQLHFYFTEKRLSQVSDEIGRTVTYCYENGLLSEVINPAGGSIRYTYSDEGKLITASDSVGSAYLVNVYDSWGRTVRQTLGDEDICTLEYLDNGHKVIVQNKYGKTIYDYNQKKMPVFVTYPDRTVLSFRYNDNNCCTYKKDRRGNEHFWKYDDFARLIWEKKPNSREIYYEYNTLGDKVREWDSAGREVIYQYNSGHCVIEKREREEIGTEHWKITAFAYDMIGRLTKKTLPSGRSISYRYTDGCGKPIYTTYDDGESVLREYDTMERMMVKEDSCGRTEYGYNTRDEISRIRDGEGNETLKLYDSLGKLICLYPPNANIKTGEGAIQFRYNYMREQDDKLYPDGSHERMKVDWEGTILKRIHPNAYDAACDDGEGESYDYDWDKNLIRIHYPDGGVERFFRDGEGNCIKHVLPEDYQSEFDDGPGYAYTYDEENRLQQILDVDGEELICYSYDLHGNRIAMRTADGNLTYYWYDLSGNLTQKAENISKGESDSALYRRTTYSYDGDGNQTEICFYGGSWYLKQEESRCWLEEKEHGEELRLSCSYDERGRLICIKDGSGACVKYSYDVRGNRISEEQIISDEITKKVFFQYDKAGRLVEKREKIAGWSGEDFIPSVQTAVTTYQRDGNGNIIEICTPEGYQILKKYDLRDRLICERVVDKENGIDRSTYIAYDRAGNPISLCRKGADGRGYEMQYDYDLKDRLVRARDLEGAVFAYQYDANDCLVKEKRPGTVEEGGSWKYQYDRQRNLCEQKNPYGEIEEQNRYDAMGHLTVKKLADGEEMYFHYGVQGNLAGLDNHRSRREGKELQTYHYNSRGQIIGVIDGNGNKTEYTLDNWGKVTRVHAADGGMECYTYDFAGNITSTTDANGGRISYRYNSQGKVCEIIDQEGMKEHFYYDREGRQILSIDRLGNQVKTVYNIDGNPVRQISCDKDGKKRDIRIWKYDSLGYLKQSIGGGFYYNYEYRPDGKLLYKESAGQLLLKYTYFPDGNVKTMTDGSGKTLRYAYDQIGRLISITDEYGKEIVNYHHTAGGKLKEICHHNGVKTTYQYDTEGNIIHLRTKTKEDNLLCDLQYEYDLNGNRTAKMGSMVLPDALGNISLQSRDIHYRYDGRNRLLSELSGKQETCYRYDLCGNRLEKRQGKRKEENYYNKKNQLKERISGNDIWKYFYDKQGNLIQESGPKRNLQYTYDTQNRQTYILSGQTVIQENRYDGEGLRAGLNVQGKESTFLFTNGNLALELDAFNQPVKRYIHGYGTAALEHHGIYHGIHRDEQLSTGWITEVSGEIENACEYDAFGNLLGNHEEVPNCILYGGQQYDTETGQYYLRARYYNPVIGRFIQEDPYRGDGLNLYAYCRNNPVVYYDPSGNEHKHNADIEKNAERENTYKDIKKLKEDFFEIYTPDGERVIDFSYLPGKDGFKIPRRLTIGEMTYLTKEYGVEFAQVYHLGPGKNGGGGVYILYSGDISSVNIAPSISPDTILINHTHPGGTPWPSSADMRLLGFLKDIGSPQNISQIIPIGKEYTIFYDINGKRK